MAKFWRKSRTENNVVGKLFPVAAMGEKEGKRAFNKCKRARKNTYEYVRKDT